ncbi:MAG: aminotransferase class V-fold PLP-dependent enzyme [Gemmatimonadota bacterium]
MNDPLSRRDFSRHAALAGLGLGVARFAPDGAADQGSARVDATGAGATPDVVEMTSQEGRLAAADFAPQRDGIYLNHAASSPLPLRTSVALRHYLDDRQRLFHLYQTGTQDYAVPPLQAKVGQLLNVPAESVGFVPSTTEAMAMALNGIDWRPGDNVVVPANEFPGVLYPCLSLERRGVTVRQVPVDRHVDLDRVLNTIDGRTRAVAISWVHWITGHRIDVARLGAACHATPTLSIVDAIQGVGAVPVDVTATQVDCFVAGSYKWLMAIPGTAPFYASPRFIAQVTPDRAGYAGMKTSVNDAPHIEWLSGAARYNVGGTINPALIGLEHSLDLLMEVGIPRVQAHTNALVDVLHRGSESAGLRFNSDLTRGHRSAFVNVTTGDTARDERLVKTLVSQKVIVGRRGPGIRVAPHLHNSVADIERFLEIVRQTT